MDAEEALWHVRAGLNVAALLCGRYPGGHDLVRRYNALLVNEKPALVIAYDSETKKYGATSPALDRHMTQLYNFFAKPEATPSLCSTAQGVATEASVMPASRLPSFAPVALERLEAAILTPVVTPRETRATEQLAQPAETGEWRIQLGAFTGQLAAQTAWSKIRTKLSSLAGYTPYYEPVPNSPLVRVQIGAGRERTGALKLCAAAATGGFDCMPVAQRTSRTKSSPRIR